MHLLERLLGTELCGDSSRSAIRATCKWLRLAFDDCNTRMVLQGPLSGLGCPQLDVPLRARHMSMLKSLLSRSPCVTDLSLAQCKKIFIVGEQVFSGPELAELMDCIPWSRLLNLKLRCLHQLKGLPLPMCDGLPYPLSTLRQLLLQDCSQLVDLSPISACMTLRRLQICSCAELVDIAPVSNLATLQHLALINCCGVRSISPLSTCTALQHLDLSGCVWLDDLSPLSACTALQHLDLSGGNHRLVDISPLSTCMALQHLDFSDCDQLLVDMSPHSPLSICKTLQLLQHLDLHGCKRLDGISLLSAWM